MGKIHGGKAVTLNLSIEQYEELLKRAEEKELTIANYLRELIGFPIEQHGKRKDLAEKEKATP